MNVLIISHTYCAKINRDKWRVLANLYPDANITVIFPKVWPDVMFTHRSQDLSSEKMQNCKFLALDAFKAGNEVLYGYYPRALIRAIRGASPDIIHVEQGDNAFSYFQSIIIARLFCRKAKFVFFTWINWVARHGLKYKLIWRFVERFNLKLSNGAIVGNKLAGEILTSKGFYKPFMTLPQLGVDLKFFTPAKKSEDEIVISFIGRLVSEKGIYILLEAFEALANKHENIRLLYVGGGDQEEGLRAKIKESSCSNRVSMMPSVDHYKIREVFAAVDILVLPSYDTDEWKEQFGHVLIEAMASGVINVGSDAGEIPNVIQDSGLIFKQKDVSSLQQELEKIILDKDLRTSLSNKGLERVLLDYSHEAIAKKTYNFWNKIIKEK